MATRHPCSRTEEVNPKPKPGTNSSTTVEWLVVMAKTWAQQLFLLFSNQVLVFASMADTDKLGCGLKMKDPISLVTNNCLYGPSSRPRTAVGGAAFC